MSRRRRRHCVFGVDSRLRLVGEIESHDVENRIVGIFGRRPRGKTHHHTVRAQFVSARLRKQLGDRVRWLNLRIQLPAELQVVRWTVATAGGSRRGVRRCSEGFV